MTQPNIPFCPLTKNELPFLKQSVVPSPINISQIWKQKWYWRIWAQNCKKRSKWVETQVSKMQMNQKGPMHEQLWQMHIVFGTIHIRLLLMISMRCARRSYLHRWLNITLSLSTLYLLFNNEVSLFIFVGKDSYAYRLQIDHISVYSAENLLKKTGVWMQ